MAVSVKIDDALKDRVRVIAAARKRSPHWILREAIARYVDQEEASEALKQSARDAWMAYQETGLHLSFEEADGWLAELEAGANEVRPECHR